MFWRKWTFWWQQPEPALAHWQVILYTRQGCHLCETAHQQLQAYQRRWRFALRVVDIDTDAELVQRYDTQVPVVAVNGKVRFRGAINPVLWRRLLVAEGAPSARPLNEDH
ncbi:MAG: glutaredoxin family protein [Gemmataceae bacterium]